MKNIQPSTCIDGKTSGYSHETQTINQFSSLPEVLTFNLNWAGDPSSSEILKFMVAVPIHF